MVVSAVNIFLYILFIQRRLVVAANFSTLDKKAASVDASGKR